MLAESAGEDEEEAGQGSVLRGGNSGGGTDTYIDIPKTDGTLAMNLLEKPCIDKKVKVSEKPF